MRWTWQLRRIPICGGISICWTAACTTTVFRYWFVWNWHYRLAGGVGKHKAKRDPIFVERVERIAFEVFRPYSHERKTSLLQAIGGPHAWFYRGRRSDKFQMVETAWDAYR